MATHDVDKKILGRLAFAIDDMYPEFGAALYQLLGLSELLSRRLLKARKHRKARNKGHDAVNVYHHVIWMSREGLAIVEKFFPLADQEGAFPAEMRVFFYKLRASFYHIFVLFHNNPRVSLTAPSKNSSARATPLSPSSRSGNDRRPQGLESPKDNAERTSSQTARRTGGGLREPIISVLSDESTVTNPWATLSPPPGLGGIRQELQPAPEPGAFLLPAANYLQTAAGCFATAHSLAMATLPGSSPLRLSVGLEYCAFLWDCQHDHDGCRKLASETINYVWEAGEGMEDDAFEDAAQLVGTLGRMMRRRSQDDTPKLAPGSPDNPGVTGVTRESVYTDDNPPPPLPKDDPPPSGSGRKGKRREQQKSLGSLQNSNQNIPRRPVGSSTLNQVQSSPGKSPNAITRKPVGSGSKRSASPSGPGSPSKKSSIPRPRTTQSEASDDTVLPPRTSNTGSQAGER